MAKEFIVSGDSHVVEPVGLYKDPGSQRASLPAPQPFGLGKMMI